MAHETTCLWLLPSDLTRFTVFRRIGPNSQHRLPGILIPIQLGHQPRYGGFRVQEATTPPARYAGSILP